jgi:cell division protein FtsB
MPVTVTKTTWQLGNTLKAIKSVRDQIAGLQKKAALVRRRDRLQKKLEELERGDDGKADA